MTKKDLPKGKEALGTVSPEDWISANCSTVGYGFEMVDQAAVNPHVYLNHLFNAAELRKVNEGEQFFSNDLLRELRDGVVDFATVGKVTAQQLPLPRPELVRGGYTYDTGAHTYQAKEITPGFHASPKFLHENIKKLPISDFQNVIVTTKIDAEKKAMMVEKMPINYSCKSIVRHLKSPTSTAVFDAQFDNTAHGPAWSIAVYTDAAKPSSHWVELVVNTAEQFGSRREHTTPYVVEIEADHEKIQKFTTDLHKAVESSKSKTDQHKLLYFLTSVLYFQADPEMPYTSPDVKPGNINPELPYDLFNLPMGNRGISKIPEIIDTAMQSPDGFKVIQELCNGNRDSDRDRMINVESTQSSLKEVFGDQYDQLADLVKKEMREMGDGIKQKVEHELESREKRNTNFDKVWGEMEPTILKSLSDAIGMDITTDPNQLKKLKEMMNLENLVRSYKGMNQSGEDQLELTLSWLNRQLITSAMSAFMKDSITSILKAPIPALKKIGVKNTFVKAWQQVRGDAERRFAISPKQMDDALREHVRSDNNKIEEIFDEELRQANLTKSFKR